MITPAIAIDAHAHEFRRGLPLSPQRRYAPDYDAPVDCYLRLLDEAGLSNGLLIQPSFLGSDNSYLLESLERAPRRLRGVAVIEPPVDRSELIRMDAAGIVGIRLNLLSVDIPDIRSESWRALFSNLARLNWHVEIQHKAGSLAPLVEELLGVGLNVVIDHFGLPDPACGERDPAWLAILPHARSRRLWMKISAGYRSGPAGHEIARKLYPQVRDAFGLERLMWGSDWPHTQFESTQSYAKSRASVMDLVGSEADLAQIMSSPASLLRV